MAVCVEIEHLDLSWSKNLQVYRDNSMPWIPKCLARIPQNMEKTEELTLLTFLSCVGMLMNGDFVSYMKIESLIPKLPMTQDRLQTMQILSNCSLLRVCTSFVWRLHEDIPHKLGTRRKLKPAQSNKRKEPDDNDQRMEDVQEVSLEDLPAVLPTRIVRSLPSRTSVHWTLIEDLLVLLTEPPSHKEAYKKYCDACKEKGVPLRTFRAFRTRQAQIIKDVRKTHSSSS